MPAVVTAKKPKPGKPAPRVTTSAEARPAPANDAGKSAIVTVRRRKHAALSHLFEEMTPEEHKRRGAAADALWREMVRRVREDRC